MAALDNIASGLVSYWPLNEVSGTRLDFRGLNDLTEVNPPVASATGKVNLGADFTPSNELVNTAPTGLSFGAGTFTYAGWIKTDTLPNNRTVLILDAFPGGGQLEYIAFQNVSNGKLQFTVSPDGTAGTNVFSPQNVGTGVFKFFVCGYDSGAQRIFSGLDNAGVNVTTFAPPIFTGTGDFGLGPAVGTLSAYDGIMDEIAVWNRLLTAGEQTALFNGGAGVDLLQEILRFSLQADADFTTALSFAGEKLLVFSSQSDADFTMFPRVTRGLDF